MTNQHEEAMQPDQTRPPAPRTPQQASLPLEAPAATVPPARKLPEALHAAARPAMVRVAPGRHAWVPAAKSREDISQHVLCRWSRQPDGTYRPVPMPYRLVRMTPSLTAMLGFVSGNRAIRADTLLRLGHAGFIDCVRISPNCWMLDLDSWFRHLAACLDDPEYWDEGSEARQRYNHANGLGIDHG